MKKKMERYFGMHQIRYAGRLAGIMLITSLFSFLKNIVFVLFGKALAAFAHINAYFLAFAFSFLPACG